MGLNDFRESLAKQCGGSPIYFGNMCFYVRRWGIYESQKAEKAIRMRLFSPIHRYTDADENVIIAEWLCEYGVAKWENVFDDEAGTEIAYSNQQARRLFLNEEFYRSLNIFLLNAAKNYENFLHDKKEEDLAELKKL